VESAGTPLAAARNDMHLSITIVSDNYLLGTLLQRSLSEHFAEVTTVPSGAPLAESGSGESGLILLDVEDAEACAELLLAARGEGRRLHRVILLLRSEEQAGQFQAFLGEIGAMLPPVTTAVDIARVANALNEGLCIWPRTLAERLIRSRNSRQDKPGAVDQLTERERLVLEHLSSGESNKAIASALNISDSTVRVHVRAVIRKLGVKNRTQAALQAVRFG
jgi:two-component system, NarL family, nitrate/nitrite response regulator NarL